MTQEEYTTTRRKFQHLTKEKRTQIEILLRQGMSKTQIAQAVGISRSTLYNELKRGTIEQIDTNLKKYSRYFWDAGQRVYEKHRENSRPPMKLMKAYDFVRYAEKQILQNKMSPDALCGEAKLSGRFQETVCTKTLYNYIDKRMLKVRNIDLPLRVKRKVHTDKCRQNRRLYGMSIEERPAEVNERTAFGHWEIDTIVGNKESSAVLLSLDERFPRKRHLVKIPSRSSEAVRLGLERSPSYTEKDLKRSLSRLQATTATNLLTLANTCQNRQKCTMLTRIPPMKEALMKNKTPLSAVFSRKASLLTMLLMNK